MRAGTKWLETLVLGACLGAVTGGCQTHDLEPVDPLTLSQTTVEETLVILRRKADVMLLVDTSGSMTFPVDASDPDCTVRVDGEPVICGLDGATACNTAVCPTRWSELQAAMPGFLAESGTEARLGLTTFPDTRGEQGVLAACRPASSSTVLADVPRAEDDATLLAHANGINALLQGIPNAGAGQPTGGTPTSQSLRFVGDLPAFESTERQHFVVLLTDGVPNCNAENVWQGGDAQCRCTTVGCSGLLSRRGCLDQDASVQAVKDLAAKGIQTIVVGFGAETAQGDGPQVLNAMAREGGMARSCLPGQTSCGPADACEATTRLCQHAYYQAGNQAELANILRQIRARILYPDPCLVRLVPSQLPSDPRLVVAYVEGERLTAGDDTWVLEDEGVRFQGATCERILTSDPSLPVHLEIRAIRQH